MIKIIKHGQKEFTHTCSRCGCEFTYEYEDITLSNFVICPDCGEHCYIGGTKPSAPKIGWPTPGEPIPCNIPSDTGLDPCSNCDWWKKMQQPGFTYVGDTPCTWCNKNKFYANTLDPNTKTGENFLQWVSTKTCKEYTTPCVEINTAQGLNFDDSGTNTCSNKSISQK